MQEQAALGGQLGDASEVEAGDRDLVVAGSADSCAGCSQHAHHVHWLRRTQSDAIARRGGEQLGDAGLGYQPAASDNDEAVCDAKPGERRYALPAAHRPVFVDGEDLNHLAPLVTIAIDVLAPMEAVLAAYRSGAGVPYKAYGIHEAVGAINRPQFVNLVADWVAHSGG